MDCSFRNSRGAFRYRAAAIIIENGSVLMARNRQPAYWYSVGGAVRLGETSRDAVIREVEEETGVHYDVDRLCFVHECFFPDAPETGGFPCHEVALYYLMKPRPAPDPGSGSPAVLGDRLAWLPVDGLEGLRLYPEFFKTRLRELPKAPAHIVSREHESAPRPEQEPEGDEFFLDTEDLRTDEIYLRLTGTSPADEAKGFVPAYRFDIVLTEGEIRAGVCDLRVGHNDNTALGGNIGYTVFEAYRGRHYAAKACRLLFRLARRHGMDHLLITCDPSNAASNRTCVLARGRLVGTVPVPGGHELYLQGHREENVYRFDLRP